MLPVRSYYKAGNGTRSNEAMKCYAPRLGASHHRSDGRRARAERISDQADPLDHSLAAGGGMDASHGPIAIKLSEVLGQPIVYENRGGSGGLIAGGVVARSAPDGYTFLTGSNNTHISPTLLYDKAPYDQVKNYALAPLDPGRDDHRQVCEKRRTEPMPQATAKCCANNWTIRGLELPRFDYFGQQWHHTSVSFRLVQYCAHVRREQRLPQPAL
jgi:hypothetical protein